MDLKNEFKTGDLIFCCRTETIYVFKRYFLWGDKILVNYPPSSGWNFDSLAYIKDCVPITPLMEELL